MKAPAGKVRTIAKAAPKKAATSNVVLNKVVSATTVSKKELLEKGSDASFRQYIHDMFAFSTRMQEVRNRFGAFIGVSGSQYIILVAISRLQGKLGVGVNTIAKHLQISSAFITMEVNNLVTAGLVNKGTDALDRRRVRLLVSALGHQQLEKLKAIQAPVNDAIFSSLTRKEFETLCNIQRRLVQHSVEALALLDFYAAKTGTYGN